MLRLRVFRVQSLSRGNPGVRVQGLRGWVCALLMMLHAMVMS